MDYGYLSEKLSDARHCLMLPHSQGIDASISEAFRECSQGFYRMDETGLDDNARSWVAKIKEMMEIPRPFSTDKQIELSRVVDELAHWSNSKFWTDVKA